MNDTAQTLVRYLVKTLAGAAIAHGYIQGANTEMIIAVIVSLISAVWGVMHRTSPAQEAPRRSGVIMCMLGLLVLVVASGCASDPAKLQNKRRVIAGSGAVTSLGISENPMTGLYEAALKHGAMSFLVVPSEYNATNGTWSTPDAVMSYEPQGRNGIFGVAGATTTIAVGSNAVNTLLGGAHYPINQNLVGSTNIGSVIPK